MVAPCTRDLHHPEARAADPQAEIDVLGPEGGRVVEAVDRVERAASEDLAGTDGEVDVGDVGAPLPRRALVDVGPVERSRATLRRNVGALPADASGACAVNTGAASPMSSSATRGATRQARVSGWRQASLSRKHT